MWGPFYLLIEMIKKRKKERKNWWYHRGIVRGMADIKFLRMEGQMDPKQELDRSKMHGPAEDRQKEAQGPDAGGLLEDFVARGRVSLLSASNLRIGGEA